MYRTQLEGYKRCAAALEELGVQEGIQSLIFETLRSPNPEVAKRYELELLFGAEGIRSNFPVPFCFDDCYSLVLKYKASVDGDEVSLPLAVASFHVRGCRPSLIIPPYRLFITQLQGVKQSLGSISPEIASSLKKGTSLIVWPVLLTRIVILLARALSDIEQVWIKKASHNDYYRVLYADLSEQYRAHNQRLEARYDHTAAECGFVTKELAHVFTLSEPSSA